MFGPAPRKTLSRPVRQVKS